MFQYLRREQNRADIDANKIPNLIMKKKINIWVYFALTTYYLYTLAVCMHMHVTQLSIHLFIYLFIYLFVCLFVCLFI